METISNETRVSVTGNNGHNSGDDEVDEEEDDDRLSSLPDEVLEHILSFLPTLNAVRTTILCRRFRNLWASVRSLWFDENQFHSPRKLCFYRQSHRNVTIIGYGEGTSAFVLRSVEVLIRNAFVLDKLVIKKETETPGKDMLTYEELYNVTRKLLAIPRAATHAKVRIGVDLVLRDAHGCCFWCNHRTC